MRLPETPCPGPSAMRPLLLSAILLVTAAAPALAETTSGTVLAYDRAAGRLVLDDRTVWKLGKALVPADLAVDDEVTITYTAGGDEGIRSVQSVERKEE